MIQVKAGVRLHELQPQLLWALMVVDGVFAVMGLPTVVTSVNDGKHSDISWHYKGRAFDVRTKYDILNGQEQALVKRIKLALGGVEDEHGKVWCADFDVVAEAVGTENEHIHVEYDPK